MGIYQKTKYPGIFKYSGKNGEAYGIDYYAAGKKHREIVGPLLAYSGDSGHLFRSIPATHSGAFRPPIPEDSGHPPGGGATLELTDGSSAHGVGDFLSVDAFF